MKIIVPFCPHSAAEIYQVDLECFLGADLIEWRADYLPADEVLNMAELVFEKFSAWPILFTLRTAQEGGLFDQGEEAYFSILQAILRDFHPAYVDLEAYSKPNMIKKLADFRDQLVFSYHNFDGLPDNVAAIMSDLAKANPALIKIALKVTSQREVWQVLLMASQFRENFPLPLVMIAMGEKGKISRLVDSPWTFARLNENKAVDTLGQWSLAETKQLLEKLTHLEKVHQHAD